MAGAAAAFLRQVLFQVAMLAGSLAVACGAVLVLRRLDGGFAPPPGPEALLATCGAGLLLVALGDLAGRSTASRATVPPMAWLPAVLARLGLLMGVAAVGLPPRGTSSVDTLATAAAVFVSLVAVVRGPVADRVGIWLERRRPAAAGRREAPIAAAAPPTAALATEAMATSPESMPPAGWSSGLPAGSLLQRFERLALPEGAECVRGRLCVAVPKGTRSGYGHVGFCPPLPSQPTVDVTSDYDGVEAVVSAAEVLPWGVRIECRLDEPAEETIEIPVDILVTTAA